MKLNRTTSVGLVLSGLLVVFLAFQNFSYYGMNYREPNAARVLVTTLYSTLLQRVPDSAGLNYWTNQLIGGMNPVSVVVSFATGSEYQNLMASTPNQYYVSSLYYGFLRRAPDVGGAKYWTAELDKGGSRADVAKSIILSSEFDLAKFMNSSSPPGLTFSPLSPGLPGISGITVVSTKSNFYIQPYIMNTSQIAVKGMASLTCEVREAANLQNFYMKQENNGVLLSLALEPMYNVNYSSHNVGAVLPKPGVNYVGTCFLRQEKDNTQVATYAGTILGKFTFSFVGGGNSELAPSPSPAPTQGPTPTPAPTPAPAPSRPRY